MITEIIRSTIFIGCGSFLGSAALAYMCLKFYDEPVRLWLSKDKTLK